MGSCFGACDVDMELLKEVDVLLHFAHTPILKIDNVIYVEYKIDFDASKIEIDVPEKKLALISTAQYCHKLKEVKEKLEKLGYEVEIKKGSGRVVYPGQVLGCNYTALRGSKAEAIVFVGDGMFHAIGAAVYTGKKVYAFNPITGELKVVDISDFVKRRYTLISKCKMLEKVGIIVSSKLGQKRLNLAFKIRDLARKFNKKCYIVYLNEVTPEKLYNLPFDYYVNTACPRISYDDSELYQKPVITPQEFEIVLGVREDLRMDEIE